MAKRSPNPAFRSKFRQSIKVRLDIRLDLTYIHTLHEQAMKHKHQSDYTSTSAALTTYLNDSTEPDLDNDNDVGDVGEVEIPEIDNETALCLSMEKLFCIGMKQSRFKVSFITCSTLLPSKCTPPISTLVNTWLIPTHGSHRYTRRR